MGISSVTVVGLGYIGLPTAAILAINDVDVIGVDINPETVEAVNAGQMPFVEPDLATLLAGAVTQGTLRAVTRPEPADAYILAVPTPFTEGHKPDLSHIRAAAESVAPLLTGGELVVLESTSPPGTTRRVADLILALRPDLSLDGLEGRPAVHFAHCPERVLPGRIVLELVENDRVIGGLTPEATERARDLYATFCKGEILLTDAPTAEMTKLVENAYRDVNIAFANEISIIADRVGVDVWELIRLANHHPRVHILQPGPGVGGHCIAVDPWFIVDAAPEESRLISTARSVNDAKPMMVADKIIEKARTIPGDISVLGLTFKADVDDARESPAVLIVEAVARALPNRRIIALEPHLRTLPKPLEGIANVHFATEFEASSGATVLLVGHREFSDIARSLIGSSSFMSFIDIGTPSLRADA